MSLVGSLEDLGLGDILQIVSLSGKSGVLTVRSDDGGGRIVFRNGLILGAVLKGGPTSLGDLIASSDLLPESELTSLAAEARSRNLPLERVLVERTKLEAEQIDTLRRENVESVVLRMFALPNGEFSFEVRDEEGEETESDLYLEQGINAQFLALEGTRISDEDDRGVAQTREGEARPTAAEADPAAAAVDAEEGAMDLPLVEAIPLGADEDDESAVAPEETVLETDAEEASPELDAEDAEPVVRSESSPAAGATRRRLPPVVVIDRNLASLEWTKRALAPAFARVHIFQRTELGISRIRQYLVRSEVPIVLLATDAPPDPVSGARTAEAVAERLRAQAPRMPLLWLGEADGVAAGPGGAASATKPGATLLADPRAESRREALAGALRERLLDLPRSGEPASGRSTPNEFSPDALKRLKRASARLRDPASRGEVLRLVLQFAAETFGRVAIFMIREGRAIGIAQVGLAAAGGPDDAGLHELTFPATEPEWFRHVLERRAAVRSAPSNEGDRKLVARLGESCPPEAYVAPIESGEQIVALLYADNLPGNEPLADASVLEVVLHEAGLALDRALLERALAEAEGEPEGSRK